MGDMMNTKLDLTAAAQKPPANTLWIPLSFLSAFGVVATVITFTVFISMDTLERQADARLRKAVVACERLVGEEAMWDRATPLADRDCSIIKGRFLQKQKAERLGQEGKEQQHARSIVRAALSDR